MRKKCKEEPVARKRHYSRLWEAEKMEKGLTFCFCAFFFVLYPSFLFQTYSLRDPIFLFNPLWTFSVSHGSMVHNGLSGANRSSARSSACSSARSSARSSTCFTACPVYLVVSKLVGKKERLNVSISDCSKSRWSMRGLRFVQVTNRLSDLSSNQWTSSLILENVCRPRADCGASTG